jgi:hypothetical protein
MTVCANGNRLADSDVVFVATDGAFVEFIVIGL